MKHWLVIALLGLSLPATAFEALPDESLSAVTAQDGIALGLEYGVNTDASGNPLASLGGCSGTGAVTATTGDRCRFSWQIAARTAGGGEWTVFKNSYMSLSIPTLNIGVTTTMGTIGSSTTYFDATRFQRENGTCLLPGGSCLAATIDSLPALTLFYPAGATPSYNPVGGVSTGYDSVAFGLTIGRMSMEYGATGYLNDAATGSFLSAKIADNNNANFSAIKFTGKALIYGF
ncbi:MAG: hypothetical protein K0S46_485 [Moraxellaceae bacterium]|jgi:hypothetical protein|nr:hypothetical protein [Moraxellaceae bacterium]